MFIGTLESCCQGTKKAKMTPTPKTSKKAVTLAKKRVDDEEGKNRLTGKRNKVPRRAKKRTMAAKVDRLLYGPLSTTTRFVRASGPLFV